MPDLKPDERERLQRENARLLKAIADDRPDGKWIDRHGGCRVCGGEIPHGHTDNCDHWKLEQQLTAAQAKIAELERERDRFKSEVLSQTGCDEAEFDEAFFKLGKPVLNRRNGRVNQRWADAANQLDAISAALDAAGVRTHHEHPPELLEPRAEDDDRAIEHFSKPVPLTPLERLGLLVEERERLEGECRDYKIGVQASRDRLTKIANALGLAGAMWKDYGWRRFEEEITALRTANAELRKVLEEWRGLMQRVVSNDDDYLPIDEIEDALGSHVG